MGQSTDVLWEFYGVQLSGVQYVITVYIAELPRCRVLNMSPIDR